MPGPKPRSQVRFTRIHNEITQLFSISTTAQQRTVLKNLREGLNAIEHLWHDPISADSMVGKSQAYIIGARTAEVDKARQTQSHSPYDPDMQPQENSDWMAGYDGG